MKERFPSSSGNPMENFTMPRTEVTYDGPVIGKPLEGAEPMDAFDIHKSPFLPKEEGNPLSAEEIDTIVATKPADAALDSPFAATSARRGRRVLVEKPDGTAYTDAEWDQANAAGHEKMAANGQQTILEQRQEWLAQQATPEVPEGYTAEDVARYGELLGKVDKATLDQLYREQQERDANPDAPLTARHATTGQEMNIADMKAATARASESRSDSEHGERSPSEVIRGDAAEISAELEQLLERNAAELTIEAMANGGVTETDKLDNEHAVRTVFDSEGNLLDVVVFAAGETTSGTQEMHTVEAENPNGSVAIKIDGEPTDDPKLLETAEAVFDHTVEQVQAQVVDQPAGPAPEAVPVAAAEAAAPVSQPEVQPTQAFDPEKASRVIVERLGGLMDGNMRQIIDESGLDMRGLVERGKQGKLNLTSEAMAEFAAIHNEAVADKRVSVVDAQPGNASMLQQVANKQRHALAERANVRRQRLLTLLNTL